MENWAQLTDIEIGLVIDKMPGGTLGYMKEWGWLTFARAIEEAARLKNAPDAEPRDCVQIGRDRLAAYRNHFSTNASYQSYLVKEIDKILEAPSESGE